MSRPVPRVTGSSWRSEECDRTGSGSGSDPPWVPPVSEGKEETRPPTGSASLGFSSLSLKQSFCFSSFLQTRQVPPAAHEEFTSDFQTSSSCCTLKHMNYLSFESFVCNVTSQSVCYSVNLTQEIRFLSFLLQKTCKYLMISLFFSSSLRTFCHIIVKSH